MVRICRRFENTGSGPFLNLAQMTKIRMLFHGVYIHKRHTESKFGMFSVKSQLYLITSQQNLPAGKYLFNFNSNVTRTKFSAHT